MILYSPFFTGACYRDLPVGKPRFEKIVGDAGLLDFLELRLGISVTESDAIDRILAYCDALKTVREGAFYEEAFKNDPLATAKEILHWRDVLVMEGFDAGIGYKSGRLKTLAQVEWEFRKSALTGTPERWMNVHALARGKAPGADIVVCHDRALLPKLIRETLEAFGVTEGPYDGLGEKKIPWDSEGKDISILQFGTVAEAYRWAVEHNDCEAVICPDPFRLNAVLRNREKPLLEASAGGDSSITQLFRLGLSLLERPLNVQNLLEFLRMNVSPFHGHSLAFALKRDGGLGEEWRKALDKCKDDARIVSFLLSLLDADIQNGKVSASVVTGWCRSVEGWIPTAMTEERKPYLLELAGLCRSMCRVIENETSDKVDVKFVLKAVKTLYAPSPVQSVKAMESSWDTVDSHRSLIDAPESLLWLPCNGNLGTAWPYSFMLQEEIQEMGVKEMPDYVKYDFNLMVSRLGQVGRIVLCTCDFDCEDALEEHPAVTLCKSSVKEKDMRPAADSPTSIFKRLRTIETGVNLFPKEKKEGGREEDISLSATSIESLIAHPFDFVMSKTLGFRDLSSLQLSDLTPTQGTVAHYVFERMLEDAHQSVGSMRAMLEKDVFEKRIEKAAEEKGAILLQPELRTLFSHFKDTVRESIKALLDILDASGLTPVNSEEPLNQDLDVSHVTGSVDFYAETKDGEIVVIDFKYSKGKTYIEKLEKDKSVQLEIYAQGLEDKLHRPVVARGYYFFPINQLHTDDDKGYFRMGKGVFLHKKAKCAYSLKDRIENSVAVRKEQLEAGTLEMEEGAPLEEIDYHMKAADGSLIDIPADKKAKACSPFVKPTKYPILKDFIK